VVSTLRGDFVRLSLPVYIGDGYAVSTRRPSSRVPWFDVPQSARRTSIAKRAQQETGSSAARASTLEGANIVGLSKPCRPLEGDLSKLPCFHGSGPTGTAIAFVRFAR
jgi:hypothetical protein